MGKSRQEDPESFLSWIIEIIKEKSIDILVVANNIFDTGIPPNYANEPCYNFLKQLSIIESLNITIITAGNHDTISTLKAPLKMKDIFIRWRLYWKSF